jgi:OmpA-OmpF porin, OOP family
MNRRTAVGLICVCIAASGAAPLARGAESVTAVPLIEGLMLIKAVHEPGQGDYEPLTKVTSIGPEEITVEAVAMLPDGGRIEITRSIRKQDLKSAHQIRTYWDSDDPLEFPGTTAFSVSTEVLSELRSKRKTLLAMPGPAGFAGNGAARTGTQLGGMLGETAQMAEAVAMLGGSTTSKGELKRAEGTTVPYSVIVNDVRVDLPAVHAVGTINGQDADFVILDDLGNPIVLRWQVGDHTSQIVKISYPAPASQTTLEQRLSEAGRAEVYGIYFDFAKATLRPESDAVLAEISALMKKNPAWKLKVEGHTDNIGGDTQNLDLSKRRAAAVKQALASAYGIDSNRLTTAGYGASRPKDTNETLQGRALNRRVELAR